MMLDNKSEKQPSVLRRDIEGCFFSCIETEIVV